MKDLSKVITSCQTLDQLHSATTYCGLWTKQAITKGDWRLALSCWMSASTLINTKAQLIALKEIRKCL